MDEVSKYNLERWNAMADANAIFTRPKLDFDLQAARDHIDEEGVFGDVAGKNVLCLASGGGQQSICFGRLGANVTVFDISEKQIERDRQAAEFYKLKIETAQGDMRDLSRFDEASFDIVYHAYSINFVPDAKAVFRGVARVLRSEGVYHFNCANPFFIALKQADWNGEGYVLKSPYIDGAVVEYEDESWVFQGENPEKAINPCREFRHNLSRLVNGLIENDLTILKILEQNLGTPDLNAEPGTSDHFTAFAPPWLKFWAVRN